ncbi:hypothetical protein DPX16_14686 [Anabarilius grahami]|uniref:Uncharacterized protein n=1 Tax=Anabarilius grahami TaxID=495550 RepID=A0A3N0XQL6_ANAGA|nr:hypothetical protein DPX16_14686 [Anabarilius grahami]
MAAMTWRGSGAAAFLVDDSGVVAILSEDTGLVTMLSEDTGVRKLWLGGHCDDFASLRWISELKPSLPGRSSRRLEEALTAVKKALQRTELGSPDDDSGGTLADCRLERCSRAARLKSIFPAV